ncbi:tetratricopeptide repeat protein [Flavobacterium branchiophilum]|uniref:Tetratricopeptide repeat protein n=1 Tax=Flavobacterium branchiophilum TaxID=55197 RepID=A0A2H3KUF7_9FLAO|nr:hypothetical protein [Flavobacterium branchiophilum]PDS21959.1 hypothetical protein B0A77_14650 [Flavobacterium branchiophilum]
MNYERSLILYREAMSFYKLNNYDEALDLFYKSNKLYEHGKTYQKIAEIQCFKENLHDALLNAEMAYKLLPITDSVCLLYAELLVKNDEKVKSIEILESIIKRNSTFKKAKLLLDNLK